MMEILFSARISHIYIHAHVHTYLQRTFLSFQIQQKQAKERNVRIEDAYAMLMCDFNIVPSWLI